MGDAMNAEDATAYRHVGLTLLAGLLLSIAVMAIGLLATAISGGNTSNVLTLDRVIPDLLAGHAPAVLDLGILLLFATPLVAVLVAFIEFVRQHDGFFVGVTALLLVVLVISFAVALH